MEKTKDQILLEKLRKCGHRARMNPPRFPMPPMRGNGPFPRPPMEGKGMPPMGCHGPMNGPGPMGGHGPCGRPGPGMPRELLLMAVLDAGDSGIRQKDIADAVGINASSLSEQIDALESDRYLERKANPDDKRSTLIVLTEKGRARAYEVLDERQKAAADFCGKLTEEEKDTLIALLDKLLSGSV